MAAISRFKAGFVGTDAELTCRLWCNLKVSEMVLLSKRLEDSSTSNEQNIYTTWISGIEASF